MSMEHKPHSVPWGKSPGRLRKLAKIALRNGGQWRCCWCGGHLYPESATLEHIIPRAHGGTDALRNLDMACIPCNTARGAPDYEVYLAQEAVW